jgi:hypothetical protein
MNWSKEQLDESRRRFLAALEDPDHWVWDRLFFGICNTSINSIVVVSDRHPFGHDCQMCDKWRKENSELAQIETDVLERRKLRGIN